MKLIDWCLTKILPVFHLYRGAIDWKMSKTVANYLFFFRSTGTAYPSGAPEFTPGF